MDDEIARLAKEERLEEAAELASTRGDFAAASALFERGCQYARAAREALRAGDAARALLLGVAGADEGLAREALPQVVAAGLSACEGTARKLEQRGDHAWAARLWEAAGKRFEAARAWERGGDALRAAALFEATRDAAQAARALEAAIRRDPERWSLHVALGELLRRYGKYDAATRALQRVPPEAPERRAALVPLVFCFDKLHLAQAAEEGRRELEALGGALTAHSERPPAEAPKARLFGRYEVIRDVASTPNARVVECTDVVRGEHVAVKVMAGHDGRAGGRDALARFEREVRAMSALEHANVVPLRDYVPEGPAIVMAWMGGGTLEQMLATAGALAPSRAVEIACAVLGALGEGHRLGILHRDVKPANVLFDDAGVARLGDFGVAHLGDLSATATAGWIGTLAYMSPEQRDGRPATVRSDVYGVGVMLREMLTGAKPRANDTGVDEGARALPSAVHRDLDARHDAVVVAMTEPDPAARPEGAFEARRALLALPWPNTIERAAPAPDAERAASARPGEARLDPTADPAVDTWVGRGVERMPLTDAALRRASAFAKADDDALQTVLRVDRAAGEIWLEALRGHPLDRPLRAVERERLGIALDALHHAGAAHGSVDASHVWVTEHGVVLRFAPEIAPTSTQDLDRVALSRL